MAGFLTFHLYENKIKLLAYPIEVMTFFFPVGAVIGDGQSAVASNIANTTYRLQWWDFTKYDLPEISNGKRLLQ